jgi:hypothetical protein
MSAISRRRLLAGATAWGRRAGVSIDAVRTRRASPDVVLGRQTVAGPCRCRGQSRVRLNVQPARQASSVISRFASTLHDVVQLFEGFDQVQHLERVGRAERDLRLGDHRVRRTRSRTWHPGTPGARPADHPARSDLGCVVAEMHVLGARVERQLEEPCPRPCRSASTVIRPFCSNSQPTLPDSPSAPLPR